MITALNNLATALKEVATELSGVSSSDVTNFAETLGEKLLEYVIIEFLDGYRPVLLRVLTLLGIADLDYVPPVSGDPAKVAYQRHDLTLSNAGSLLSDSASYLLTLYGWNTASLNAADMLQRISNLFTEFGVPSSYAQATTTLTVLPFVFSPTTGQNPQGLAAMLGMAITDGTTITVPSMLPPGWNLQLIASGALDAGIELASLEGMFVAPEGAACIPALRKLFATGFLKPSERIVIYNTGAGLKYLEAYAQRYPRS